MSMSRISTNLVSRSKSTLKVAEKPIFSDEDMSKFKFLD